MNKRPVLYMQTDSRWASISYANPDEETNIAESGCGPSCASMIIETLTGKTFTPADACRWSLTHGHKASRQGTYYSYFVPQFAAFGINCRQLNSASVYGKPTASAIAEAFTLLKEGYYIIACMGKGTWCNSGHFVVLWWADNKVRINDPASTKDARVNGNLSTFKKEIKYLWAIDAREYNNGNKSTGMVSSSTKKIVKIPTSNIGKIEIYVNEKSSKKTLATIMKETGADYGINGGLYNSDWTPCPLLKKDGVMLSKAPYSMYGYGWGSGSDIECSATHANYENYIGCVTLLNPVTGKSTVNDKGATGGTRGRSAIGLAGDNLILYCTKDGSKDAAKPSELQQEMLDLGCDTCTMLDGGGSSQCNFNGSTISSTRKVHNYILIYLKGNSGATATTKTSIKDIQGALNDRDNFNLVVDGLWGPKSKQAMIKAVQIEINELYGGKLVVDGSWGPASKAACPDIKSVTRNDLAWLIQACLIVKGYDVMPDGSYGPSCVAAIKQFQKANGLKVDGICGPNTMTKLLG